MMTWMKIEMGNGKPLLQVDCDYGDALNHCSKYEFYQDT